MEKLENLMNNLFFKYFKEISDIPRESGNEKEISDYLLNFGGHIGYSVRKSERLKGYATEMLALGLIECKELNINKVLITCDKDNVASAKTIIANGGKLENEILEGNRTTQRYWISLD